MGQISEGFSMGSLLLCEIMDYVVFQLLPFNRCVFSAFACANRCRWGKSSKMLTKSENIHSQENRKAKDAVTKLPLISYLPATEAVLLQWEMAECNCTYMWLLWMRRSEVIFFFFPSVIQSIDVLRLCNWGHYTCDVWTKLHTHADCQHNADSLLTTCCSDLQASVEKHWLSALVFRQIKQCTGPWL